MGGKYRATGRAHGGGGWSQALGFFGTCCLALVIWTVQALSPFAYWMSCGDADACSYGNDDVVGLVFFGAPLILGAAALVLGLVFHQGGRPYFYLPLAALAGAELVYVVVGLALPNR